MRHGKRTTRPLRIIVCLAPACRVDPVVSTRAGWPDRRVPHRTGRPIETSLRRVIQGKPQALFSMLANFPENSPFHGDPAL